LNDLPLALSLSRDDVQLAGKSSGKAYLLRQTGIPGRPIVTPTVHFAACLRGAETAGRHLPPAKRFFTYLNAGAALRIQPPQLLQQAAGESHAHQ
jgi:hypothetical protein